MSFAKMPVDDLIRMAQAGGGFRQAAVHRYPDALNQIATAAKLAVPRLFSLAWPGTTRMT